MTDEIFRINTDIFIHMHDGAFRYFGGMPEECVYDQTKLVVIDEIAREITVNQRFNEYATVAGFDIHACRGYDPESKGKVEAGVKYVKNNCFYAQEFATEQSMHEYLANWLTKANNRTHGTTGKVPKEVLANEELKYLKDYLIPDGWKSSKPLLTRKADKTSLISWNGNKYSIPDSYQDSNVGVEPSGNHLYVYDLETNSEIAQIELSDLKGETFKNPSHYRRSLISDKKFEEELHELIGEVAIEICKLLKQSSPKIYRAQVRGFIALIRQYENITPSELSLLTGLDRLTVKTAQVFIDASREPANDKGTIKPHKLSQYASINLSNSGVNNG